LEESFARECGPMRKRTYFIFTFIVMTIFAGVGWPQEKVDLEAMTRIRYEGFHNSQVEDLAAGLLDDIGPRLTGSPNMKRANEWTRDKLKSFGLANPHLESWGPFGRGWSQRYINVRMVSPDVAPFIAYAKAWTPGTKGAVTAGCIRANIESEKDFDKYRGKLAGMIVLLGPDPEVKPISVAPYRRLTEQDLSEISQYAIQSEKPKFSFDEHLKLLAFQKALNKFLADERAVAVIDYGRLTSGGGTVAVSGGVFETGQSSTIPALTIAVEHWTRIARLLQRKKDVQLELNVVNDFYDDESPQYNTVAEILGTDAKEQIVMLGAHLDSWHSGTGATDNGAGCIVMMEAVRILQSLGIRPRRTIRIALWSGEEQGMLGSQRYVEDHFGARPQSDRPEWKGSPTLFLTEAGPVMAKAEQTKVSVYFNLDNGTGRIRGVYLQENAAVGPIFEAWMRPFQDLGMSTLTMRDTGGTDHLAFDFVGIPAFQFVQDPIEYSTRTHHSNMDVYDRLQFDDLKQAAVVVAGFVYDAAMRDQMLPRKPIEMSSPTEPHRD
jgi:carboxypeptidase Q